MSSYSLSEINKAAASLVAADFTAKYCHPFLVTENTQSTIDVDSSQTMGLCYMPTQVASQQATDRTVYEVVTGSSSESQVVTLGRLSSNDIVIDDPSVSKVHARLLVKSGGSLLELTDAGSRNGTHATGLQVAPDSPLEVRSGTIISFGRVPLRFVSTEELFLYLKALRSEGEL